MTEALVMCQQRGVVFGMCTGDDPRVARSIMLREMDKAGFTKLRESCRCLEGAQLFALSPSDVAEFVRTAKICGFFCVSNAKPEHKRRVVQVGGLIVASELLVHVHAREMMFFRCSRRPAWKCALWATAPTMS